MKLTKRQNEIMWKLQNGWIFVTGQEFGAILTKGFDNDHVRLDVFYTLVKIGLIYQESKYWNYVLTKEGAEIKTKLPDTTYTYQRLHK